MANHHSGIEALIADSGLTALDVFRGSYDEAAAAVQVLGEAIAIRKMQTLGAATSSIIIPGSNIRLTQGEEYFLEADALAVSYHVNIAQGRMLRGKSHEPVLSVTRLFDDEGSPTDISAAAYRGREEFPDFFMKQHPFYGNIDCRVGAVGLREGVRDFFPEIQGETFVPPDTEIGSIDAVDRQRLATVSLAIRDRADTITRAAHALMDPDVRLVEYNRGEPLVVQQYTPTAPPRGSS